MALLSAAVTGVYGFTGVAVAPLASGGAPDVLGAAKLTPNVDFSTSEPASSAAGVPSTGTAGVSLLTAVGVPFVLEGTSVSILFSFGSLVQRSSFLAAF